MSQESLLAPSLDELREAVLLIPNSDLVFPDRTSYLKMGYASALSVMLLLMLLVITLVQLRLLRTNWEY